MGKFKFKFEFIKLVKLFKFAKSIRAAICVFILCILFFSFITIIFLILVLLFIFFIFIFLFVLLFLLFVLLFLIFIFVFLIVLFIIFTKHQQLRTTSVLLWIEPKLEPKLRNAGMELPTELSSLQYGMARCCFFNF